MRLTLVLFSFLATMVPSVPAQNPKTQGQIGELLIVADGVETTTERVGSDKRTYKSAPDFHFIRVTATVRNAGKHALCTHLYATLETTFNLKTEGSVNFGNYLDRIFQLLPDEKVVGEILFSVKDGVEPLTLVVMQGDRKQGCSEIEPLRINGPLRIRVPVASIPKIK